MRKILILLVAVLFVGMANAALVPLENGEFDQADTGNGVPGWTFWGANIKINYWPGSDNTPDPGGELQTGWRNGEAMYQVISDPLQADTIYTLTTSFKVGDVGTGTNGVELAFAMIDDQGGKTWFGSGGLYATDLNYNEYSFSIDTSEAEFANLIGQDVRVQVTRKGWYWTNFDYVRLDATPVPEPATMALLGLGGFVVTLGRRKRK